jgi:hypothetical protein
MLRRLGNALRRQDPAAVLIEILILVVGIALALQVDEWRAERQQRQLESSLIERLILDFQQIENRLTDSIEQFENFRGGIAFVRDTVRSGQPPDAEEEIDQFLEGLGEITASRIPAGRSPTFIEMLSTGVFDVLQDEDLKQRLIEYDQVQGISMTGWKTLRDQALLFSPTIFHAMTLADPAEDALNMNPVAFDFDRMRNDADFDGALGVQLFVQANNQQLQVTQLTAARAVLELLANQEQP